MDNIIERMARAHWERANATGSWDALHPTMKASKCADMRAALAVLREPSEYMKNCGSVARYSNDASCEGIYQAMIDAAEGE